MCDGYRQLTAERHSASFSVRAMTFLLDAQFALPMEQVPSQFRPGIRVNGRITTELREKFEQIIATEPVFERGPEQYLLGRAERIAKSVAKCRRLVELARQHGLLHTHDVEYSDPQIKYQASIQSKQSTSTSFLTNSAFWLLRQCVHDEMGCDLHILMFIPSLRATFTAAQQALWVPQAEQWRIIGCYCQTELGHGSNVQAIETTATYIHATDEIEIHTPSLTAIKWWPGALAATANHAMVFARLIVPRNGGNVENDNLKSTNTSKDMSYDWGVHNFVVPLRDMQTHCPLPGITIGDVGPKMGYASNDNGYVHFDRVRIPRATHMGMARAILGKEGHYHLLPVSLSPTEQNSSRRDRAEKILLYKTMTDVRAYFVKWSCAQILSKAVTIAVRYSAVRRQGFGKRKAGIKSLISVFMII